MRRTVTNPAITCSDSVPSVEPRGPQVISLIIVNAVVGALRQHGAGPYLSEALRNAQSAFALSPQSTMSRVTFLRDVELACGALQDPAVGLALGESLSEMSFHFIGPLVARQVTLRDAMNTFLQLSDGVLGGAHWIHSQRGDESMVGFSLARELGRAGHLQAELAVTAVYRSLVHWLGADGKGAVVATFGYPAPSHVESYRAVFGQHVEFDQAVTGVRFPSALLERTRPGADEVYARHVREFSQRWLPGRSESWSARVRAAFASAHSLAELSFDDLARQWGLSSRSLRRRLASENTSLSVLLEEARLTRSRDLLAQRQYSLPQIASMLGYSEANSFQRAFKRWAGMTPGSYRRSSKSVAEAQRAVG
jgi:AraC-like DNA-binding protein